MPRNDPKSNSHLREALGAVSKCCNHLDSALGALQESKGLTGVRLVERELQDFFSDVREFEDELRGLLGMGPNTSNQKGD